LLDNQLFTIKIRNKMKKILLAIALVLTIGLSVNAQSDSWFRSSGDEGYTGRTDGMPVAPQKPLGSHENENAPLGSGLLVFTALGIGYALKHKNK
jgi:hypothetical protein